MTIDRGRGLRRAVKRRPRAAIALAATGLLASLVLSTWRGRRQSAARLAAERATPRQTVATDPASTR